MAAPIPREPPVTSAVFPLRFSFISSLPVTHVNRWQYALPIKDISPILAEVPGGRTEIALVSPNAFRDLQSSAIPPGSGIKLTVRITKGIGLAPETACKKAADSPYPALNEGGLQTTDGFPRCSCAMPRFARRPRAANLVPHRWGIPVLPGLYPVASSSIQNEPNRSNRP
jgi:hypothetical protein